MLLHYCLSFGTTAVALLFIACFVYLANTSSQINKVFALYSLAIATWAALSIPAILTINSNISVVWCRGLIAAVITIPTLFFHFVTAYIEKINESFSNKDTVFWGKPIFQKRILKLSYAITLIFLVLDIFTDKVIVAAMPKFSLRNYSVPGPIFHFHVLYFLVITAYGVGLLFRRLSAFEESDKLTDQFKQLRLLSWTSFVGYLGGLPNYTVVYNLEIPIINPFGTYAVAVYAGVTAYTILRYKFLDIEIIIKRTAVFAGLFAFVYGVFAAVTIVGQEFIKRGPEWNSWVSTIPIMLIITLALKPLENFLTDVTEKFLFQKKYDYRQLLKTFADEILTILDLQKLLDQTVLQLSKLIKLDAACVLLHQKSEKCYTIVAAVGLKEKDVVFQDNDLLISMLREGHHPIQRDKASKDIDGDGRLKDDFKKIKAQLCLPIMLHDELIGVLALGMKKSGEDFTPDDIDVLSTLARTEAIAISNAQLFDELSKTQAEAAQREKMAVIGTLAAGINHEICNPLGIVRGQCEMFLLNMRDGLYQDKTPEQMVQISSDIMAKVIKETDRATGITKKLSSFAKPSKKNDVEDVSIKHEIDEILGLLGHDLKLSNIEFRFNLPEGFPDILVDRKQFQEVLFNIIRNAAQAMDKKSGYIAIDGFTEPSAVGIRIADNGMGIPREKINQIFNPFFTTKAPGKGTGLGLFIVKQVVERNKGTIEVDSVDGEGTTFTLRFPAALKLAAA